MFFVSKNGHVRFIYLTQLLIEQESRNLVRFKVIFITSEQKFR